VVASGSTAVVVIVVCVVFSALAGRWWTLALPVALAFGSFALAQIDWYYERTPEDVQAGLFVGAGYAVVLAALALAIRHRFGRRAQAKT
jgi:urea transporter